MTVRETRLAEPVDLCAPGVFDYAELPVEMVQSHPLELSNPDRPFT